MSLDRRQVLAGALAVCAASPLAATPRRNHLSNAVIELDPRLRQIIAPDAELQIIHRGNGFFEAPLWVPEGRDGYLAFTDIAENLIGKIDARGRVSAILSPSYTGVDVSRIPVFKKGERYITMAGPNGLSRDPESRLVFCGFAGSRSVQRIESDGRLTVLADRFDGLRFNTPNDLAFASDGSLYFTDTDMRSPLVREADLRRPDGDPDKGVPHGGLYLLKDGIVSLVSKDFEQPNGIAIAPNQNALFVTETFRRRIRKLVLAPGGTVQEISTFFDMGISPTPGVADGIKVDRSGNVFSTGPGGVWIFSPAGEHLGTIRLPEFTTNLCFGGRDGRTLYLSSLSTLYRVGLRQA